MSMQLLSGYASSGYHDVSWKGIFCDAGMAVSTNKNPMGLVNSRNLIMVPDNFGDYDHFQICFPWNNAACIGNDISYRTVQCKLFSGLIFLQIDGKYLKNTNENNAYLLFLQEIIFRVANSCKSIFKYTYEHLSQRYYDDCVISKISIIQSDFSVIYVKIEKLTVAAKNIVCIHDVVYCISIAIEILSVLSTLSGARCVLRNRSIELLYHLKLFEKFIEDVDNNIIGASAPCLQNI